MMGVMCLKCNRVPWFRLGEKDSLSKWLEWRVGQTKVWGNMYKRQKSIWEPRKDCERKLPQQKTEVVWDWMLVSGDSNPRWH